MKVDKVITGYLRENCYIIGNLEKCIVIDPGDDTDKIIECINNREVVSIFVTHSHFDHVGSLKELEDKYNCTTYDYDYCKKNNLNEINIDIFKCEVIYNPGHSMDSISFYFKSINSMFVGDFIFEGTVGRCDLEGGSNTLMNSSIEMIKNYDDGIIIYPGHGSSTTLGNEKKYNLFFI